MAINKDNKYEEHLIERFRQLGSSTTNWALLFSAALIYTWLISIYPRAKFIDNYVTVINKYTYFHTLASRKQQERRSFVHASKDSLLKYRLIINKAQYEALTVKRKNYINNLDSAVSNLISAVSMADTFKSNPKRLTLLLERAGLLKGIEKKRVWDTIRQHYLPIDILIAVSEMRKADAEKQRDSLNKVAVAFNVPGLSTFNFEFRAGLMVWMILALVLLCYLFSKRLIMIRYLRDIYNSQKNSLGADIKEWNKLDLQVPVWLGPVYFRKGDDEPVFRSLIGWRFTRLNNIIAIGLLLSLMGMQLFVAWLCWHVSVIPFFDNVFSQIACAAFVFISLFLFLLWLQPVDLSPKFGDGEHFDFKKREMIKLAISSLVFLLIIPPVGKIVPLMKGEDLNYKRSRKRTKNKYKINMADGFYLHRNKQKQIIHYFSGGKSPSMKSIDENGMKKLSRKLRKINIIQILDASDFNAYNIPYWPFVLEKEAYNYAMKKDYITAIKIILFSLSYSTGTGLNYIAQGRFESPFQRADGTEVASLQDRLTNFLVGLILRAEKQLTGSARTEMWAVINDRTRTIPGQILKPDFISFYRENEYYIKKWQTAKKLNWHLPSQ